jgi:hypothetical protein
MLVGTKGTVLKMYWGHLKSCGSVIGIAAGYKLDDQHIGVQPIE